MRHQTQFVNLARVLSNCYYALVDERTELYGPFRCQRMIHINNAVFPQQFPPNLRPHDPPTVSLICEWRLLKNIPNQLLALALAQQTSPFLAMLVIKRDRDQLARRYAETVGLEFEIREWRPWRDYLAMIAADIDIGMQVSFTESFNFVTLDHLQAGKPVVGSAAIRFLPTEWQANADDPRDISRRLVNIIADYENSSRIAKAIADEKVQTSNTAFLSTFRGLLNGARVCPA